MYPIKSILYSIFSSPTGRSTSWCFMCMYVTTFCYLSLCEPMSAWVSSYLPVAVVCVNQSDVSIAFFWHWRDVICMCVCFWPLCYWSIPQILASHWSTLMRHWKCDIALNGAGAMGWIYSVHFKLSWHNLAQAFKVAIVYGVWGKVVIVYGVWGKVAIV